MAKHYIGQNRKEELDWLINEWLVSGPPICFLQGFSGIGKSDLANELRGFALRECGFEHAAINQVADNLSPNVLETLMELSGSLSSQGLPEMEHVLFERGDPNLAFALEKALQRKVLIVIDESQRFLLTGTSDPFPEVRGILAHLRNRQDLPGRLLLITDRLIEPGARWAEWIPKRTLQKLQTGEAIQLLETRLQELNILDAIPPARSKEDIVSTLDFNPGAIEVLVGALTFDTIDEIIGSKPDLWETKDRVMSREFLDALERDLLERTMSHLDGICPFAST